MDLDIKFDVSGLVDAVELAERALEANVRAALVASAVGVANQARTSHEYKDRTRTLTNSIHSGRLSGSWTSGTLTVTVIADAGHAAPIEYGSRPHEIRPRRRKYLRFVVGGRTVFAKRVHHPGTRPYEFLAKALEVQMAAFEGRIGSAIEHSLQAAGL